MSNELEELYQDLILDHFKNPRCSECVHNPSSSSHLFNPLCGDQINLGLKVENDIVEKIGYKANGCSISQAAASMMAEICQGKSAQEVQRMCTLFMQLMKGEKKPEDCQDLGDALALEGVRKFSARIKCAALAWEAMQKCLDDARSLDSKQL